MSAHASPHHLSLATPGRHTGSDRSSCESVLVAHEVEAGAPVALHVGLQLVGEHVEPCHWQRQTQDQHGRTRLAVELPRLELVLAQVVVLLCSGGQRSGCRATAWGGSAGGDSSGRAPRSVGVDGRQQHNSRMGDTATQHMQAPAATSATSSHWLQLPALGTGADTSSQARRRRGQVGFAAPPRPDPRAPHRPQRMAAPNTPPSTCSLPP